MKFLARVVLAGAIAAAGAMHTAPASANCTVPVVCDLDCQDPNDPACQCITVYVGGKPVGPCFRYVP